MNVLFDKGTPHPLRRSLRPHAVTLIEQMGWPETIKNGDLLRAAEQAGFAAIVTTDTLQWSHSFESWGNCAESYGYINNGTYFNGAASLMDAETVMAAVRDRSVLKASMGPHH